MLSCGAQGAKPNAKHNPHRHLTTNPATAYFRKVAKKGKSWGFLVKIGDFAAQWLNEQLVSSAQFLSE